MKEVSYGSSPKSGHDQARAVVESEKCRSCFVRRLGLSTLQAGLLAIAFIILWRRYSPCGAPRSVGAHDKPQWSTSIPEMLRYKPQYKDCPSISTTQSWQSGYNISTDSDVTVWRLNDSSTSSQQRVLQGQISILRGNASQQSDIEVHVISQSSDEEELRNITFEISETSLDINYIPSENGNSCTDIKVLVYLRPEPKKLLDTFAIWSENLDIWFYHKLNWDIKHLHIHTTHGDSTFEANGWEEEVVVHNIYASVGTGTMFGYYVAHGNITLKSDSGSIGIFYVPNYGAYYRPESLTVVSNSGSIHIQASVEYWTAFALTHSTKVHSTSGDIESQTVHGRYTNISTESGNIDAYILPFGLPTSETLSEIYTRSNAGDVDFWIEESWQQSLNGTYDPMLNSISDHSVQDGKMTLRYPYSWYGSMEGRIDSGELKFDSSNLEDLDRGEGYVKAKRGTRGKSKAEAWVGTGALDIRLGL
ncbi:predicted protein [Plenodomus lingam JN3]|uniref:Predicted protein n=1 Tax=Leptosphaeria maculans (strain JN3 / isolate v23.1.3 / race Av1-4-5-6-7-8) TaxID=985895 RepID=E5A9Z0_LEPMJ|nr:predicted protein [Plenodomus lingam JN3]CBY00481.1 predicted protein [Plenodomus lingam JN3]